MCGTYCETSLKRQKKLKPNEIEMEGPIANVVLLSGQKSKRSNISGPKMVNPARGCSEMDQ